MLVPKMSNVTITSTGTQSPGAPVQVVQYGGPAVTGVVVDAASVEGGHGTRVTISFDPMWTPPSGPQNTDVTVEFHKGTRQSRSNVTDGGSVDDAAIAFAEPWAILSAAKTGPFDKLTVTVTVAAD